MTEETKTVWTYDCSAPGKGVAIRTPKGRIWTRVNKQEVAKKIVGTFNFAKQLEEAARSGDMGSIRSVLSTYDVPKQ